MSHDGLVERRGRMSFQDIFKSNFLENVNAVTLLDMGIALVLAFTMGLFIFFVYKKSYSGLMYSSSFATTLIALTMITTLVILAITSNIILSLGPECTEAEAASEDHLSFIAEATFSKLNLKLLHNLGALR